MTESKNAIFLSYASEDAAPAQRLCATLRASGIEVWFDQSELRGGDAWDQKIRREIRDCALFMPVISANTQGRLEGYFRREWKLAAARTHDMADDKPFLVPVVIDGTKEQDARVPEQFRSVQWTSVRAGEIAADFVDRVRHLLLPNPTAPTQTRAESGASLAPRMHSASPAPRPIPDKSIAVLPFADMSAQKDQEYFSDGLAEALIDMLTQVRDLRVPARTSSFSFKGKSDDIASIAEKLRVAHVLEGSVRKAGSTVRVTAHLIRADDGYHLWSKTYDRDIEDIFKVQDEIAGIVVEALKAKLLPPEGVVNPHRTSNMEAYEHYLLAKHFYSRGAFQDADRVVTALQQALALDPDYAPAYALLAINISQRVAQGGDQARGNMEDAIAAAEQAVKLAPGLAEAYSARSYIRSTLWDWNGAQSDINEALKLDPRSDVTQRRYGLLMASMGHLTEAIAATLEATRIEPLDINAWILLGWFYNADGQFTPAHRALSHALELSPKSALAIVLLVQNRVATGETAEAQKINARQQIEHWRWHMHAVIEHRLGHANESQRILDDLIEKYGQRFPALIATMYAWRGEADSAFDWLERAYQQPDSMLGLIQFSEISPALGGDPRYKALLRKMNFPD